MPEPTAARLLADFRDVRATTERLCAPLQIEDYVPQAMPDASPPKWHLAHTTWFFETFILAERAGHEPFHPKFGFLFNSYYEAAGPRHPRPARGLITRPTVAEVYRYRRAVDRSIGECLERADAKELGRLAPLLTLGLHHEQQHQELLLTDLKYAFSCNPLLPTYQPRPIDEAAEAMPLTWREFPAGVHEIGHNGPEFAFDNESPRHRVYGDGFQLAGRLVTNGEYLHFLEDGGYRRPELWLSDGWAANQAHRWEAPLYWRREGDTWLTFTLAGERPVVAAEPVTHVSFYEADAYARWAEARLSTEAEWEFAAAAIAVTGPCLDSGRLHPVPLAAQTLDGGPAQMFGDTWQWTASPYVPYPGYRPAVGALGEYNGKFMCNQMVLRGGSCVTPRSHLRRTYRNFFPPEARWQFSGIRLARDL